LAADDGRIGGRIVFVGCARDCGAHLPRVLANIAAMGALFDDMAVVVAENDSADDTVARLRAWGASHPLTILDLQGLKHVPVRALRLEMARNAGLTYVREHRELSSFDWLAVLDLDEPNKPAPDLDAVRRAIAFLDAEPNRVAGFANQKGLYYDVWTLRHPQLSPNDAWEAVLDHQLAHRCSDEEAFNAAFRPRLRPIASDQAPIEVNSAFGGLGFYKLKAAITNSHPYRGTKVKILSHEGRTRAYRWQLSEHVHFHEGLRRHGGRLFILPFLINCDATGYNIPPSSFRHMLF
jgi:hypothetical protein